MEEAAKVEIVSKNTITPSSPTPSHLQHFKLSLLDQLAPRSFYVPVVLFFSSPSDDDLCFTKISQKLKSSLSQVLTLYYLFCGRFKGGKSNVHVDCNDQGALYLEAKIPVKLSDFLKRNSKLNGIKLFLPLDPYNPKQENDQEHPYIMEVQVTEFSCGSLAIGVCISHYICDGATIASFLQAWSKKAMKQLENDAAADDFSPNMEASLLFQAKEVEINTTSRVMGEKNISTRRFLFSDKSLQELRDKLISEDSYRQPTRVEAVTALIWKSAMEATGGACHHSLMSHAVNIRSRMVPPLPETTIGNLWQQAFSPLMEVDKSKEIKLKDLAMVVRETIKKIDKDYVTKLQGDAIGLFEVLKSLQEVKVLVMEKGVPCYSFSSWIRFGFYEVEFGFGKPIWVCTVGVPIRNVIILMPSKYEDGIEAWVTLNELHMTHFENNQQLLQFASFDY
ncbi:stemmadenine O-acetyltransferase-like [Prosopis cineraria]|uniref:stemmadenine O-acetyltransferase-like n=1 Tax=Prosopis cineraria TaxID=364024 RepID=UPI00240FD4F2|nr:stemmadenine O-acetyltransferase-like [Prosopis cineraria]